MHKLYRQMISKRFLNKYRQIISKEEQELINEFIITFSRFEYALKTTITYAIGNDNRVNPNWDRFISSVRNNFDKSKTLELTEASDFLLQNPPRKQTLVNSSLSWSARVFQDNVPDINKLSLHIRDIRNNLFHGGKFNVAYEQDISRNYQLINSALIILNELIVLNAEVEEAFVSDLQ